MATDESTNGDAQKGNEEARPMRRRRTPEERLEAALKTLEKAKATVKKEENAVRATNRKKKNEADRTRRGNDRASDGILGGMFKRRVRDGDSEARAMYLRLRREFPADREHVVLQFDEEIGFANWDRAAETARSRRPDTTQGHSQFPQP